MKQPSVLFINRLYPPGRGASGRVLRDLARGFSKNGWSVTVLTTGVRDSKAFDGSVRVIRIKAKQESRSVLSLIMIWLRLFIKALFLPKKDMVITMTDPPILVFAGRLLSIIKKSKHIHWCQNLYPDLLPAIGVRISTKWIKFLKKISRRSMKKCDKVVVIGRCMAKKLMHSGVTPSNIAVIPNWPDYELLGPDGQKRASKRKIPVIHEVKGARPFEEQLQDSKGPKFRVLYSGVVGAAHPIKIILDTASILSKEAPDVEFIFVGEGPGFESLAKERAKRGLDNIKLLPNQPASRLRDLMESGDLHLITMKNEAEGLLVPCKLYSALAVERPCILIGPEESEAARIINEFNAGDVLPHGQSSKLVQTIKNYRMNPEAWFKAHEGAVCASKIFIPQESIMAFITRANDLVKPAKSSSFHSPINRSRKAS
jgi:glycosyltransferase involved in cell wall biosynthesis